MADALTRTKVTLPELNKARDLGRDAFRRGMKRIPAHDALLMPLLEGRPVSGGSVQLITVWLAGWDAANLAAPY